MVPIGALRLHPDFGVWHIRDKPPELLVKRADAASRLGVSLSTVRRLVAAGTLSEVRVTPDAPRIPVEDLERFAAGGGA